jgi:enterochelin esterase-like enzyme
VFCSCAIAACSRSDPEKAPGVAVVAPELSAATKPAPPASATSRDAETEAGPREPAHELTWSFDATEVGPMSVVVSIPEHNPGERFPVLIAFHGLGEAKKGPERGARGWLDDYWMGRALERLNRGFLVREDFLGFVEEQRLASINQGLKSRAYAGLVVVTPYTPTVIRGERPFDNAPPLARFVNDVLLPRVVRETPALVAPQATGVDGVSLGGRAAILVGLLKPERFGALGALQAAFDPEDVPEIVERARRALDENPELKLRLVSSDDDYYLGVNRAIARALRSAEVPHSLLVVPGPHAYEFNRGPGAYEMLLFHDRVLRGLPPL